jgi:hypothetical protein
VGFLWLYSGTEKIGGNFRRACLNWTILDRDWLPSTRRIEISWLSASFSAQRGRAGLNPLAVFQKPVFA